MQRSATIKDVAKKAGCGTATVSRVLNKTGPSSPEVQKRVLNAAKTLGFQFSDIGRSLQSQRTRTIGCVVPSLANPVFADAVQGLQEEVQRAGYQLLLTCSNYSAETETEAIHTLLAKQVDGLVLTVSDASTSEGLKIARRRGLPCCLMFNQSHDGLPTASVDNEGAARAVAEAFAQADHVHTGFLALRFNSSDRSRQRFEGFSAGCLANGMAAPVLLEIDEGSGDMLPLLRALLAANDKLSGIFASNDFLALAAIHTARSLGQRVPQDLSIVGFDGIELGTMVEPSLATIETEPKLMGSEAAMMVLAMVSGETSPKPPNPSLLYRFRPGGSLTSYMGEKAADEQKTVVKLSHDSSKTRPLKLGRTKR